MKQLTLTRHAQARFANAMISDFERPLSQLGMEEAEYMGKQIYIPNPIQQVFSSPAERALSTACIIFRELEISENDIIADTDLYSFDMEDIYRFIEGIDDTFNSVAIVGHNPAVTLLANDLTHTPIKHVPTAGVVNIQLNIAEWVDAHSGSGKLISFDHP